MNLQNLKPIIVLALCTLSVASQAYDQKSCMQGIDGASTAHLDESSTKLASALASVVGPNIGDAATINYLTLQAQMAADSLGSALIVSNLRQHGSFKKQQTIDELVNIQFQLTHRAFKNAKESFVRFTGSLVNSSLREQAFIVAKELDKISVTIRSCER
jgi:hypothetical protein